MAYGNWSLRAVLVAASIAAASFVVSPLPAQAQKYPDRPVRIVLPFGAGGVADVTARILAEKLTEKMGERFVIENMPGAGGINAARAVTTAAPDGYTLGFVTNGTAISAAIFKSLPFNPVTEFEMISTLGTFDLVFVVNADSPYKTLQDFVQAAKKEPGKLNVGTITVGGTQNLGAELFKSTANLNFQIVPFRNSGDVVVALLRNDVQMLVEFPAAVRAPIADKKARVLAVSSLKRTMPDVPTVDESGVKGYEVTSWNGVFAPKGTPKPIIDALNKNMREVLALPDVKEKFSKVGITADGSSPAELMGRLQADIKKWNAVIDKAGIQRK